MTTDNFLFYLQNRLIQTSQTGGKWYSNTSPLSIPCSDSNKAWAQTIKHYGFVIYRIHNKLVCLSNHVKLTDSIRILSYWRHETQHNDIQHNDTQHNGLTSNIQHNDTQHNYTQHNDTQHNDTQHNDTQHNDTQHNDTQHNDIQQNNAAIVLNVVVLSVIFIYCYAECHDAECRSTMLQCNLPIFSKLRVCNVL
jgi:hypothetical protein